MFEGRVFHLLRGDVLIAILTEVEDFRYADYPSEEGTYELTPDFEEVRHLFERELAIIDNEEDDDEWNDIWEELRAPGLILVSLDGRRRNPILGIHFAEDRAWWMALASP